MGAALLVDLLEAIRLLIYLGDHIGRRLRPAVENVDHVFLAPVRERLELGRQKQRRRDEQAVDFVPCLLFWLLCQDAIGCLANDAEDRSIWPSSNRRGRQMLACLISQFAQAFPTASFASDHDAVDKSAGMRQLTDRSVTSWLPP